jgi:ribosome maturation factor RimP
MASINPIEQITTMIGELLTDTPEYFLVGLKIKPTQNVKVYLDGDQGITIETCVRLNRKLYKTIEEAGIFPAGEFSLEVSSPGIDEPLTLLRQYQKNVGRKVEVTLNGDGGAQVGKLLAAQETGIEVEVTSGKGKKAITQTLSFSFDQIKSTVVQISF